MPYSRRSRRSYRRRRRPTRSTPWFKDAKSAYKLASQAAKDIWYIKGLVNSEKFHFDTNIATSINGTTGNVQCLNLIPQGDGESARTGRSILLKDVYIRARMYKDPAATVSRVMCALVQDLQTISDTVPSFTDIFQSTTPETFMNLQTAGRFKVLMRKTYILDSDNPQKELIKFKKVYTHLKYNGSAAADIQKNALYLVWISSETGLTNPVTISGGARIGYHDN